MAIHNYKIKYKTFILLINPLNDMFYLDRMCTCTDDPSSSVINDININSVYVSWDIMTFLKRFLHNNVILTINTTKELIIL